MARPRITRTRTGFKTVRGEGDSPILLRRLRKIGTVPDGFETSSSTAQHHDELVEGHQASPGYSPIIVSSLLFGLLHVGHGADPIPLFVLGLFLGYAYRQTHRILAPLVIHMLVNSVAIVELWILYFRGAS
jgi:CAAX prenyl protease-like protein